MRAPVEPTTSAHSACGLWVDCGATRVTVGWSRRLSVHNAETVMVRPRVAVDVISPRWKVGVPTLPRSVIGECARLVSAGGGGLATAVGVAPGTAASRGCFAIEWIATSSPRPSAIPMMAKRMVGRKSYTAPVYSVIKERRPDRVREAEAAADQPESHHKEVDGFVARFTYRISQTTPVRGSIQYGHTLSAIPIGRRLDR
jgi:hypothetical protein